MIVFDPRYPPTTNSLNRLRLTAAFLPAEIQGKSGYELVSAAALNTLIADRPHAKATFFEHITVDMAWAIAIAETIGTRLGYLLLTLVRNNVQTRAANPDKDAAYWAYWSTVRTVYLGGGLIMGRLGQIVTARAQSTLHEHTHEPDYQVVQAASPRYLPLLGAARTIQTGKRALVLDFGGTFIKRGIAHYTAQGLNQMQILRILPGEFSDSGEDPQRIFRRMIAIIVQSYADVDSPTIPISIAAYVDEWGQPLPAQGGIYRHLAQLTGNLPGAFSQAVSDRLGKTVQVNILHDSTAAALSVAPLEKAAVIMIGTALGSGYPVARPGLPLCPVLSSLPVTEADND